MEYETCPQCDGLGFEIVLLTPWYEDEENSPITCDYCSGTGLIDFNS